MRQLLPLETPCLLAAVVGLKHQNLGPESRFPGKQGCFGPIFYPWRNRDRHSYGTEEVFFFPLCALHHSMENKWIYVEITAVSFVVKVAETNQMEHRFTYQKYIVSLVFLYCYPSPQCFHSYSIHCWKGEQIIPPFYISKTVMIS